MTETDKQQPNPAGPVRCPHCAHPQMVQIRAGEVIAIYKCPNCGELVAPIKHHRR